MPDISYVRCERLPFVLILFLNEISNPDLSVAYKGDTEDSFSHLYVLADEIKGKYGQGCKGSQNKSHGVDYAKGVYAVEEHRYKGTSPSADGVIA